jgi:HlyD family secretion protein
MEIPELLRNRRLLAGVAFVAVLLAMGLWPRSVPVEVGRVSRGALRVTVDEEGETRVRERYVVSAPVAGRLLRIALEPGDAVVAGETVLATLEPGAPALLDARSRAEAEARVRTASAALERARSERDRTSADLGVAESRLERQRRLAREQIVAPEALEEAEAQAEALRGLDEAAAFAVEAAAHELELARARLARTSIDGDQGDPRVSFTAPSHGVVLKRLRWSEAVVPQGEPLLEIGDPGALEVVSDMLSSDAVKIEPGAPVLIEQWGGDQALKGRVRRVEPSGFTKFSALGVEEQRVNVVVDFEDPHEAWRALGDAYRVEVRVVIWEEQDVPLLPTAALFRHGNGWAVFAVESGRARLREVEMGRRNDLEAQLLSGLEEGTAVILHPSEAIADGVRLSVEE